MSAVGEGTPAQPTATWTGLEDLRSRLRPARAEILSRIRAARSARFAAMPKYSGVYLNSIGYELAPVVVSSAELEERLAPVYARLRIQEGQLEAFTGITERRWWEPGTPLSKGAIAAARRALAASGVPAREIGALIYCGVCREQFEPATACRVAEGVGVPAHAAVYDLSNACLAVMNAILDVANRIQLGQIRAGMVVSCESAREINEVMIRRLLAEPAMEKFSIGLATLTGGSGAVALVLTDGSFGGARGHRLVGGVTRTAPQHHGLCRWGLEPLASGGAEQFMATDSVAVMKHGVELGRATWAAFLAELGWNADQIDRVVCHQVGSAHQKQILDVLGVPDAKDFSTYPFLGNIGTVSLPITAAIAEERGFLEAGQRVAFLGIGSGLNCLMLGWEW
jgi:3-oxoacyl-[acyl-carrier-protein] synthase-3